MDFIAELYDVEKRLVEQLQLDRRPTHLYIPAFRNMIALERDIDILCDEPLPVRTFELILTDGCRLVYREKTTSRERETPPVVKTSTPVSSWDADMSTDEEWKQGVEAMIAEARKRRADAS